MDELVRVPPLATIAAIIFTERDVPLPDNQYELYQGYLEFRPPQRPNTRWVGDLTGIPTDEGKLHLAAILDLHSRRCVGLAMGVHHDTALAGAALCVAIAIRGGSVAG